MSQAIHERQFKSRGTATQDGESKIEVVSYSRVSTHEQVKGYSINGQLEMTRRYAKDRGWEVVEEYVDAGFSARTDNRPSFKRMIADAKSRKFHKVHYVLVSRGDRFARNRLHAAIYKQLLREVGVQVISVTEPIEEGTPAGVILEGMNEVIAEWYSVDLSVKISESKRKRAERGLWNGPVSFGYIVGADGLLAIEPEEAQIVKDGYEKYATGRYTDQTIASWLNNTRFRPRVHRRDRKRRACLWSKDTVGEMLTNAFYLGYVKYKGRLLPGKHPPIIGQELFDQVQAVRRQHRRGPSTFAQRYRTYLLSGLIRNAECGEKLSAHHISGHDYYQVTCSRRGMPCVHSHNYIRAEIVEEQICLIISSLRLPNSWRELVLDMLCSREEADEIHKERVRLEEKLKRVKRQYREVEISEEEYRRELLLTQSKLSTLVIPEQEQIVHLGDHVEGMVLAWDHATKEERRDILRLILDSVYVDLTTKKVVGLKPKSSFLPLFDLEEPVRAGEYVLTTRLTAGDPDRIRTGDLHRDRVAC